MSEPKPVAYMRKNRGNGVVKLSDFPMLDSQLNHRNWEEEPLYPASALTSLMEENAELKAALDASEIESGLTRDGNLWRFWSQKAKDVATKLAAAEARAQAAEQAMRDLVTDLEARAVTLPNGTKQVAVSDGVYHRAKALMEKPEC